MKHQSIAKWTRRAVLATGIAGLGAAVAERTLRDVRQMSASARKRSTRQIFVTATPAMQANLFKALAREYERRNPGVEIVLDVTQSDQPALLQHTLRAALIGALPDVSFQGYEFLSLLSARGIVQPLDDRAAPAAARRIRLANGVTAGLGFTMSFPVLVCNARLLAEAGAGPAPSSWEQVIELARRVQARHSGVLGLFSRYNPFIFQGVLGSQSGRLMDEAETVIRFNDEIGQRTFDLFRAFGEAGQARSDMTRSQLRQAFANEHIAMLVDSSSSVRGYLDASRARLPIETARLPLYGPAPRLPTAGTAIVLMAKDRERAAAAWAFMQFVVSAEAQRLVSEMSAYVPANRLGGPASVRTAEDPDDPLARGAHQSLPYAAQLYAFPGDNALQIDRLFEDRLTDVVTLRLRPAAALARLETEVRTLLASRV